MVNSRLRVLRRGWRPGRCRLCAETIEPDALLCPPCAAELPWAGRACPRCAAPLPASVPEGAECGRCQRRPPPFIATRAVFAYAPPVVQLVTRFKYGGELALSRFLGEALTKAFGADGVRPDVLVPVPLHGARLRSRGYNQSLEIARYLSRALHVPLDRSGVRRVRATRPQAGLPLEERRANLRNAFQTGKSYKGLRVAIVDDVMTSGHTVSALARCLRKAGAREVVVWVIARA
jgi:ComF family protein